MKNGIHTSCSLSDFFPPETFPLECLTSAIVFFCFFISTMICGLSFVEILVESETETKALDIFSFFLFFFSP